MSTRIIERRDSRLRIGQADGIQARSVETFQAFGFAGRITEEAYRITEMCFWRPDPDDPSRIVRGSGRWTTPPASASSRTSSSTRPASWTTSPSSRPGSPGRVRPDYGYEFRSLQITQGAEHPVTAHLVRTAGEQAGQGRVVRAKYVLGADGAHSRVRDAIGCVPRGDKAFHAWGVMDVLAVTDFPDIRLKCAIQSGSGGNILLIPREGGHLFRMYVDLGVVSPEDKGAIRRTTIDQIIAKANAILHPYTLDVRHVAWHSVYEVGHRVTDRFDDIP